MINYIERKTGYSILEEKSQTHQIKKETENERVIHIRGGIKKNQLSNTVKSGETRKKLTYYGNHNIYKTTECLQENMHKSTKATLESKTRKDCPERKIKSRYSETASNIRSRVSIKI